MEEDLDFVIGNYTLRRKIGEGNFSTVWLAESRLMSEPVAIKVIPKKSFQNPQSITRFNREIALLKRLNHPFIAQFYELLEDDNYYFIVLEYAENGDLGTFVKDRGSLTELQIKHFFSQLVAVIDYLHNECRVAHRDIKPENILLDRFNNIRIIDFGLSNTFSETDPQLKTACGSPAYAAPEIILGQPYTKAADIWSLGIVLYYMANDSLPFEGGDLQLLLNKILKDRPIFGIEVPIKLADLINKMLDKSCEKRITIKQIREHSWISDDTFLPSVDMALRKLKSDTVPDPDVVRSVNQLGLQGDLISELKSDERTPMVSAYLQIERSKHIIEIFQELQSARAALPSAPMKPTPKSLPLNPAPQLFSINRIRVEAIPPTPQSGRIIMSRPNVRVATPGPELCMKKKNLSPATRSSSVTIPRP